MTRLQAPATQLAICGVGLSACYVAILLLWDHSSLPATKRIPSILTVYWIASALAMLSVWRAVIASRYDRTKPASPQQSRQDRRVVWTIVVFAILFRAIQLATSPILEIDLRRYVWDGRVTLEGISPYKLAPQQALAAEDEAQGPLQQRVIALANRSPTNRKIVAGVHYPEFTTIYPPVSQVCFAATVALIPESASMGANITGMKLMLTLFDLGVIVVLVRLLRTLAMPSGWTVAYAWSPLALKEVANSGHLDSIAVFFCMLSVHLLVQWLTSASPHGTWRRLVGGSAVCWGLSVGAKLYPLVLMPLLLTAILRAPASTIRGRNYGMAMGYLAMGMLVAGLTLAPMMLELTQPPVIAARTGVARSDSAKEGLSSFLARWEMNDLAFSAIKDNARVGNQGNNRAWYAIMPLATRAEFEAWVRQQTGSDYPGFFVARIVTLMLFGLAVSISLVCMCLAQRSAAPRELLRWTFLTLAALFFLSPTENPWYWLWALPLLPFTRNHGWHLVAPCLLIYYARFWFRAENSHWQFLGNDYYGLGVFDYLVVWLEHAPMLLGLVAGHVLSRHSE